MKKIILSLLILGGLAHASSVQDLMKELEEAQAFLLANPENKEIKEKIKALKAKLEAGKIAPKIAPKSAASAASIAPKSAASAANAAASSAALAPRTLAPRALGSSEAANAANNLSLLRPRQAEKRQQEVAPRLAPKASELATKAAAQRELAAAQAQKEAQIAKAQAQRGQAEKERQAQIAKAQAEKLEKEKLEKEKLEKEKLENVLAKPKPENQPELPKPELPKPELPKPELPKPELPKVPVKSPDQLASLHLGKYAKAVTVVGEDVAPRTTNEVAQNDLALTQRQESEPKNKLIAPSQTQAQAKDALVLAIIDSGVGKDFVKANEKGIHKNAHWVSIPDKLGYWKDYEQGYSTSLLGAAKNDSGEKEAKALIEGGFKVASLTRKGESESVASTDATNVAASIKKLSEEGVSIFAINKSGPKGAFSFLGARNEIREALKSKALVLVKEDFAYLDSDKSGLLVVDKSSCNDDSCLKNSSKEVLLAAAKLKQASPWLNGRELKQLLLASAVEHSLGTGASEMKEDFLANVDIERNFHLSQDLKGQGFTKAGKGSLSLHGSVDFKRGLSVDEGSLNLAKGSNSDILVKQGATLGVFARTASLNNLRNEGLFINDAFTTVNGSFAQAKSGVLATYMGSMLEVKEAAYLDGKLQILGKKDYLAQSDELKMPVIDAAKISGDFANIDYPIGWSLSNAGVLYGKDNSKDSYVLHFAKTTSDNLPSLKLAEDYVLGSLASHLEYAKSGSTAGATASHTKITGSFSTQERTATKQLDAAFAQNPSAFAPQSNPSSSAVLGQEINTAKTPEYSAKAKGAELQSSKPELILQAKEAEFAFAKTNGKPKDLVLGILDTGLNRDFTAANKDNIYKEAHWTSSGWQNYIKGHLGDGTGKRVGQHGEAVSNMALIQSDKGVQIANILRLAGGEGARPEDMADATDITETTRAYAKEGLRFFNRSYAPNQQPKDYLDQGSGFWTEISSAINRGALVTTGAGNWSTLDTSKFGNYNLKENDTLRKGWLVVSGYQDEEDANITKLHPASKDKDANVAKDSKAYYYKNAQGSWAKVYNRGTGCGLAGYKDCVSEYYEYFGDNFGTNTRGTSLASPTVLVLAARVYQNYPWMSNQNIKDSITSSAKKVHELKNGEYIESDEAKSLFGQGLTDSKEAIKGPKSFMEHDFVANVNIEKLFHFAKDINGDKGLQKYGQGSLALHGDLSFKGKLNVEEGKLYLAKGGQIDAQVQKAGTLGIFAREASLKNLRNEGLFVNDAITTISGDFAQSSTGILATYLGNNLRVKGIASLDGSLLVLGKKDYLASEDAISTSVLSAGKISGDFASVDYPVGWQLRGKGVSNNNYLLDFEKTTSKNASLSIDEDYLVGSLASYLEHAKTGESGLGEGKKLLSQSDFEHKATSLAAMPKTSANKLAKPNLDEDMQGLEAKAMSTASSASFVSASSTSSSIDPNSDLALFSNTVMSTLRSEAATILPLQFRSYDHAALEHLATSLIDDPNANPGFSLTLNGAKGQIHGLKTLASKESFSYMGSLDEASDTSFAAGLKLSKTDSRAKNSGFKSKTNSASAKALFALNTEHIRLDASLGHSFGKAMARFSAQDIALKLSLNTSPLSPVLSYKAINISQKAYKKDLVQIEKAKASLHKLGLGAVLKHEAESLDIEMQALFIKHFGLNKGLNAKVSAGEGEKDFAFKTKARKLKDGAKLTLKAGYAANEAISFGALVEYESSYKQLGGSLFLNAQWE